MLNKIIENVNKIINWVNGKLGTNIGTLGSVGKSDYKFGDAFSNKYFEWEATGALAPDQGYSSSAKVVPTYNIGTINIENPQSLQTMLDEINRMQTGG